jgi:hypothetical protein
MGYKDTKCIFIGYRYLISNWMRKKINGTLWVLVVVVGSGCADRRGKPVVGRDSVAPVQAVDSTPLSMARPDTSKDPRYLEALRFLATIRRADAEKMGLDAYFKQFPGYAVDSFLRYFSTDHFSISDMEKGDSDKEPYSIAELRRELNRHKGPAFEILAQMGYIYSNPYPQYSHTDFAVRPDGSGIDVNMAGNYQLSFIKDGDGNLKLSSVESDHISDQ